MGRPLRSAATKVRPQQVAPSPAIAAAVAAEIRRWVLEADDNARGFAEAARGMAVREARRDLAEAPRELAESIPEALFLGSLQIPTGQPRAVIPPRQDPDPLGGITEAEAAALKRWNEENVADSTVNIARRNLRAIMPLADEVGRSMGLAVDWTAPGGREALLDCLRAYHQANVEAAQRDQGAWIAKPEPAALPMVVNKQAEELPTIKIVMDFPFRMS